MNEILEEKRLAILPKLKRIAIQDKFYSVAGSQVYLRKLAGLELRIADFETN